MRSKIHTCQPQTLSNVVQSERGNQRDGLWSGTYGSCYAFRSLEYCGILIFFEGYLRAVWMHFRLEGTRRIVNLLTFMLRSLKAERCDFGGKNRSRAGTLSKQGFLPCPSYIWNSQRRTQIPSRSLKKPLLR